MILSRKEGGINCWDLSLFQLSLLGQEGGSKLEYAWCHPFYRFLWRSSLAKFQAFDQKTYFTKCYSLLPRNFTKEFKIAVWNWKCNHLNMNWNYSSYFQSSDQKTSFTKCVSFLWRSYKLIYKTKNGPMGAVVRVSPSYSVIQRPWS